MLKTSLAHPKAKFSLALSKGLFKSHHEALPYIETWIQYKHIDMPIYFATPYTNTYLHYWLLCEIGRGDN